MANRFHYVFSNSEVSDAHFDQLKTAARSISHLGWGIDIVVGDATLLTQSEVAELEGERWLTAKDQAINALRVPTSGTLKALVAKHKAFLSRVGEGFKPVPPLSKFRVVGYRRESDPAPPLVAAFTLLKPDASGMRSFDALRGTRDVAGMARHAVARAAQEQGWDEEKINVFIHGKTPDGAKATRGDGPPDRFQYLPIPTINHALGRVESIRRLIIAAPLHCAQEVNWARRAMAGAELAHDENSQALMTILPASDWVLRQYTESSQKWSTVTPVILPGYEDPGHLRRKLKSGVDSETQKRYLLRLDLKMEQLLRKALQQAGFSMEIVEGTEIEWRNAGFRPGVDLASRYLPPANLSGSTRVHVQLRFPTTIQGPIALGSGRFRGFGLFAKVD